MVLDKLHIAGIVFLFALLSCNQSDTLFTALRSSETDIHFANTLEKRERFGILYYLYYYNGGGVAAGDINNDGLSDIYFTANSPGNNRLYLNKGDFKFQDITESSGVAGTSDWCTGVTMADVNADGFLDIYVSSVSNAHGLKGRNELFINNRDGTFNERAAEYGLDFSGWATQAVFFDYDRDGDLDCYILCQSHRPHDNIVDTSNRRRVDRLSGDRLYRNDMTTQGGSSLVKFIDVSSQAGIYQSNLGYGLGIGVGDLNNDGWDDIYVGNDFHENDYYYVNNRDGTFSERGAQHFDHYSRFSMGNDIADFNNDGHLDVVTADMLPPDEKILKTYGSDENPDIYDFKIIRKGYQYQYSKNCLQRNNGNGSSFSEVALAAGMSATDWSWSPLFADFDNDGNKDLFITSGIVKRPVDLDYVSFVSNLYMKKALDQSADYDEMALEKMPGGEWHSHVFKGDGQIRFDDKSEEWGFKEKGFFNGAAYADLNNDGNVDLIVNRLNDEAVVYKNSGAGKNHLSFSFKGDSLNPFGIGCKVFVYAPELQYQQLMLTRGFQSSSEPRLHFGLDSAITADSVIVVWPDQRYEVLKNVEADKTHILSHANAAGKFDHMTAFQTQALIDTLTEAPVVWTHRENDFVDYNLQYLIPHAQSTRGPKIAVADINNDSLDDFFVCGARGQPGSLMIQQPSGKFSAQASEVFAADADCEDVDAEFVDVNGDGHLDLYVVSGGNEYVGEKVSLLDRLYMNDGKGKLTKSAGLLPPIYDNKSCVAAADIDKDGDVDLFIGTLAHSRAYGVPQTSRLLLNENGRFALATSQIDLNNLGIVTSGEFSDFNNDGWPDLVVAGEWMPITLFINKNGTFEKVLIPDSRGWWQTVVVADVNNDGNQDLLAGNWGLNNKFASNKNGPLKLYVSDFDKNGRTDQLMSYTKDGKEYPFLAKDEVERALPVLKKHYLLYSEYAGVVMKDVFYGFVETVEPLVAQQLASMIYYGKGNGEFQAKPLPIELQLAPIFAFAPSNNWQICGGNFFDVIPYEGRYDAQPLAMFSAGESPQYIHQPSLLAIEGQVRDIKAIRRRSDRIIVVARNDRPLLFLHHLSKPV